MADKTNGSVTITATPDQVMDVIADLEAYPDWSEGITAVEVLEEGDDGRPARASMNIVAGPIKDEYVLDYEWNGSESVSWTLDTATALKVNNGSYDLTDNGDGTTDVVYNLEIELNVPMIGMIKRKAEKQIVKAALDGLKKRVESL